MDGPNPKDIKLESPGGEKKVLLHSCCAPCAGPLIERIHASGIDLSIYFYNPNIHPRHEYEIRKNENIRYAKKLGIPFIDADYDSKHWYDVTRGHEQDPERGERCSLCFDMRFVKTAQYASEHGFKVFTTSLGISRWKDFDQVTRAGVQAASQFSELTYWELNWRKGGGSQRMSDLAKEEKFYQQEYCGCSYSLRDTNRWRASKGRPKIKMGEKFYGDTKTTTPDDPTLGSSSGA